MSSWNDGSSGQSPDPQPQDPQYPAYQNPQYPQNPQHQNPQYPNAQSPQYPNAQDPQYQNPQSPQYQNPQYQNPQYPNPQYPQYPNPQGGLPGQPAYPYGGPPPSSGMNGLAIAGFVTAFFCSIVGLVLSIIAYNQSKERNQSGRGLALAGIIISAISLVGGILIVATR